MLSVNGISAKKARIYSIVIQGFSCYHDSHFQLTCPHEFVLLSLVIIVGIGIVNHILHAEFGISPILSYLIFTTAFPEVTIMHIFQTKKLRFTEIELLFQVNN